MANKNVKQEKDGLLLLVEFVHVLSWSVTGIGLILPASLISFLCKENLYETNRNNVFFTHT